MRLCSLLLALALAANASAQCVANNQAGCVMPVVSGAQAGTSPGVTCVVGVSLSSNFSGLSGDVCYPTGHAADAPILAYFHGSSVARTFVWLNASGTKMVGGLVMGAERGWAMWSLDYAADASGMPAKWQSGRCVLYKLRSSAGTTSIPGNPAAPFVVTGDSQGGVEAMLVAQNGAGFSDSCDTTPVALSIARIVNNDGPSNWARSDLYAGSTYDNTNATVTGIANTILGCSSSATCKTADQTANYSTVAYMPLGVPLYSTGGSADTYVPWAQNCAETISAYAANWQGCAQLPGNHLGDTNLTTGKWWPWVTYAAASAGATASAGGTGAAGGTL